jgi:hypothetical protein
LPSRFVGAPEPLGLALALALPEGELGALPLASGEALFPLLLLPQAASIPAASTVDMDKVSHFFVFKTILPFYE